MEHSVAAAAALKPNPKRRQKKKKSKDRPAAAGKTGETDSIAKKVLKDSLRNRLRARRKMLSTARAGGTSQDVQNVLSKFNDDGDEQKADMMREIQEDVKGMKQKDAKKYLKQVLGTMNKEQTSTFVDMCKDKMPSGQSTNLVNYVKRQSKLSETEAQSKPQVNPQTVYTPTRLMSEDEKAAAIERRRVDTGAGTKRKKGFGKIAIHIPKLNELRALPSIEQTPEDLVPAAKKKKSFASASSTTLQQRKAEIEQIFPAPAATTPQQGSEAAAYKYAQRMKVLRAFDAARLSDRMRAFMFESAADVEILLVKETHFMPMSEVMEVPGTDETVDKSSVPPHHMAALEAVSKSWAASEDWVYHKRPESGEIYRVRNATRECTTFVLQFIPVIEWIKSLTGTKIPWKWFCEVLGDLGIMREKASGEGTEFFRILCTEFRLPSDPAKITVPILPFLRMTLA